MEGGGGVRWSSFLVLGEEEAVRGGGGGCGGRTAWSVGLVCLLGLPHLGVAAAAAVAPCG